MEGFQESNMDKSAEAVPNTSAQEQANSSPKSESSATETGKVSLDSTTSKADTAATSSMEVVQSQNTVSEESPQRTQQSEGTSASSASTNLYPMLSEEAPQTNEQDPGQEQVKTASTTREKQCSETSSGTLNEQSSAGALSDNVTNTPSTNSVLATPSKGMGVSDAANSGQKETGTSAAAAAVSDDPPNRAAEMLEPSSSSQDRPDSLPMATEAGATAAKAGGAAGGKKGGAGQGESVYYVKWILFNSSKVPIITQNENGPCPLLAIMNVLLLKGKVQLPPLVEMITSEQLMAHLGECVVESKPRNLDETNRANYEQNMQDAMNLMYKLQTGLDVNVRFTGVSDFEYTSECIIFDLLEIRLYHGWLVDPQDQDNVKAVGKCSYNQLVEKVIQNKQSEQEDLVREALTAEQFLDGTASQLTYHGLCELSSTVREHELCVFFRNNHFNTLYRHNNELFLLVTDQGFLTEGGVVWETLSNVDGDCHFVDANFCTYTKPLPPTQPLASSPYFSGDEQINSDYQVALSLQHQDQQMLAEQEAAWGQFHNEFGAAQNTDHELALRLQEEEDRRAAAALNEQRHQQAQAQAQAQAQGQGQGQGQAGADRRPREREERRDKKDGKDCCIL